MIIIEKNKGEKIPYQVDGTKVLFDDDLEVNLEKRQKEYACTIDICRDADGDLLIGTTGAQRYVAQLELPAAEYETAGEDDEEDGKEAQAKKPIDMDKVTLTLWSIE